MQPYISSYNVTSNRNTHFTTLRNIPRRPQNIIDIKLQAGRGWTWTIWARKTAESCNCVLSGHQWTVDKEEIKGFYIAITISICVWVCGRGVLFWIVCLCGYIQSTSGERAKSSGTYMWNLLRRIQRGLSSKILKYMLIIFFSLNCFHVDTRSATAASRSLSIQNFSLNAQIVERFSHSKSPLCWNESTFIGWCFPHNSTDKLLLPTRRPSWAFLGFLHSLTILL